MTIETFYERVLALMPYRENGDLPFYSRLTTCLKSYGDLVNNLEIDGKPIERKTIGNVMRICSVMGTIVKSSMEGKPSVALAHLNDLLTGANINEPKIELNKLALLAKKGNNFYRVREMDSLREVGPKELFHIPITSRGMVKTHRYSIPGYPCLYLGESIYGCWEEMRRPPMHRCGVARFRNDEEICLIDLRIPTREKLEDEQYLELMPLVMACMIKVSDDNAIYKPEYIIPQLLMEWIIIHRWYTVNEKIYPVYGVVYHSTQLNDEFDFPIDKLENYAIPVFKVDQQYKYCEMLCNTFSLTRPTTNEYEKLKEAYQYQKRNVVSDTDWKERKFWNSDFGQLERRLNNEKEFPLVKINPEDGKEKLLKGNN